jgi:hypothetical protein
MLNSARASIALLALSNLTLISPARAAPRPPMLPL